MDPSAAADATRGRALADMVESVDVVPTLPAGAGAARQDAAERARLVGADRPLALRALAGRARAALRPACRS
ncbi:hypothetical protein G6F32_016569 [Rhizopus arrhizus]|nr:hypothetical protein G6F32_016569 [Rhizopus arrhizus]